MSTQLEVKNLDFKTINVDFKTINVTNMKKSVFEKLKLEELFVSPPFNSIKRKNIKFPSPKNILSKTNLSNFDLMFD